MIKMFKFSDFAETKEEAIQFFLHWAHDFMKASDFLNQNTLLLDESAYLCHRAFELVFKAILLSQNDEYDAVHDLTKLHGALQEKIISDADISFLKIIDRFYFLRYPLEVLEKSEILEYNDLTYAPGEIGADDLEKANKLFFSLWNELQRKAEFKNIIEHIQKNPYPKGKRVLMEKPR